jgi:hypothetical protein
MPHNPNTPVSSHKGFDVVTKASLLDPSNKSSTTAGDRGANINQESPIDKFLRELRHDQKILDELIVELERIDRRDRRLQLVSVVCSIAIIVGSIGGTLYLVSIGWIPVDAFITTFGAMLGWILFERFWK